MNLKKGRGTAMTHLTKKNSAKEVNPNHSPNPDYNLGGNLSESKIRLVFMKEEELIIVLGGHHNTKLSLVWHKVRSMRCK